MAEAVSEPQSPEAYKVLTGRGVGGFQMEAGVTQIAAFRRQALADLYPERTPEEIDHFMGTVTTWGDPNRSELAGHFSFPTVYATLSPENRLTNLAYVANNASSRLPGILGRPEEIAKLFLPMDAARRHRPALIRELLGQDPKALAVTAICGLSRVHRLQPVRYYMYEEEVGTEEIIEPWGLKPIRSEQTVERPFGKGTKEVVQIPYVGTTAGEVIDNMMAIDGVVRALHTSTVVEKA